MITVNLFEKNLTPSEKKLELNLNEETFSVSSVHQVVKATLANRRQGNHSTKTRSMVSGGGAKPFKQKGTGRARQGSNRSPLMPGGGIAFGPSPRSYEQKVNKKMMLTAIETILIDKAQSGNLLVVDGFELTGKTKEISRLLSEKNCNNAYIVSGSIDDIVVRAARNLPGAKTAAVKGFSVYETVKYEKLIITKDAMESLIERLVK
jgi:large subunit ribosomal protein L4